MAMLDRWPEEVPADLLIDRNERAIFRKVEDGSGLVLHLDTADYYGLNTVGSLVWELLDGGKQWGELMREVRAAIDDPPPSLDEDIASFLRELQRRNLIELRAQE